MRARTKLDCSAIDYPSLSAEPQQVLTAGHNTIRSLAAELLAALVRWRRARAEQRQCRRAMAQLWALSDFELKDIGVHRSAIDWAVNHGRDGMERGRAG